MQRRLLRRPHGDRWLAGGYPANTRAIYRQRITNWTRWLHDFGVHPFAVKRAHAEMFGRCLTDKGLMDSTVAGHLSTIKSFYKWAFLEDYGLFALKWGA